VFSPLKIPGAFFLLPPELFLVSLFSAVFPPGIASIFFPKSSMRRVVCSRRFHVGPRSLLFDRFSSLPHPPFLDASASFQSFPIGLKHTLPPLPLCLFRILPPAIEDHLISSSPIPPSLSPGSQEDVSLCLSLPSHEFYNHFPHAPPSCIAFPPSRASSSSSCCCLFLPFFWLSPLLL